MSASEPESMKEKSQLGNSLEVHSIITIFHAPKKEPSQTYEEKATWS